jgi:hypothetical protein
MGLTLCEADLMRNSPLQSHNIPGVYAILPRVPISKRAHRIWKDRLMRISMDTYGELHHFL